MILSNDSFQEFHGQYTWLFDEGRLIGGKPVPGLGWVFLLRTPVRGPASRRSVKEARSGRRTGASSPADRSSRGRGREPSASAGGRSSGASTGGRTRGQGRDQADRNGESSRRTRERRPADQARRAAQRSAARSSTSSAPIRWAPRSRPWSTPSARTVPTPSWAMCAATSRSRPWAIRLRCAARDVLSVGETLTFTVTSIDAPRRGIDLALPVGSTLSRSADIVSQPLPQGVPIGTVARQVTARRHIENPHPRRSSLIQHHLKTITPRRRR